jgi:hypothetical protein
MSDSMATFFFWLFAFLMLLSIINYLWGLLALFIFIREDNSDLNIQEIYNKAFKKFISYAWIIILRTLIIIAGIILFVIPGIIWAIYYSLSIYVFLDENKTGYAALKENKQLVKGYWWPVFFRNLILVIIFIIIGQLILLIKSISTDNIYPLINFILETIFYFFVLAFSSVYSFFIYEDLKRVKTR